MKTLEFWGDFDEAILCQELVAEFPDWVIRIGREVVSRFWSNYSNRHLTLGVPDEADERKIEVVVVLHDPLARKTPLDYAALISIRNKYMALPDWSTWTPEQAEAAIKARVLEGQTKEQVAAWINTNVTTLATAKTALIMLADAVVMLRDMLAMVGYLLALLRDLAVRR